MKIYTYNFKNSLTLLICLTISLVAKAQKDSTKTKLLNRTKADSTQNMNMDAIYNRPFLKVGKMPVAIGGYLEVNSIYSVTNGIPAGFAFQARRLSIFFASTITKNIKFISELEFANGGQDIEVEYAAVDMELHPLLNLRGGIILNPIGSFNQNHDGPKWDFVERPLEATNIIPSTLSSVGFGLHGKYFANNWSFGYEAYLTNGFDGGIIANSDGRTSLADGNQNANKFSQINSGLPMFTGKLAIRNRRMGEIGISMLSDIYNQWRADDGLTIDNKRSVNVYAFDFSTVPLLKNRLNIRGEISKVLIQLPTNYNQMYGSQQWGAYMDIIATIIQRKMFAWDKAKINLGARLEYVDYNQGKFISTGGNIFDDIWQVTGSICFRPVGTTALRFNYIYSSQRDLQGNPPPAKTGTMEFGLSTYF